MKPIRLNKEGFICLTKKALASYLVAKQKVNHTNWQRGFLRVSKNILLSYLIISIVILGTGLIYLFNPFIKSVEAVWFDDNWAYRKPITFTHNAAVSTPSQVELDIDTTASPDSFQADCGDVRFTDPNGNLLKYYLDSAAGACDTASTDFDVLMPTIINGSNLIYMYYGNPTSRDGTETADFSDATTSPSGGAPSAGTEANAPPPRLYWEFDDIAVGTAEDSTTNGLDGTHNNSPTIQTEDMCIAGKCLWFDGTSDENVSKSDDAKLDFAAADSFTISAWAKRNGASSANNVIITKASGNLGTTYQGYKLYMDASGDFCFATRDGTLAEDSACTSAVDFDDDKWHLVQGAKSGTTSITLYVDGKQRAQDASIASTGSLANAGIFYAGIDQDALATEWLGFIDEVKVYPSARSAAQIAADFNARSNNEGAGARFGVDPNNTFNALNNGLVGYWKEDETTNGATATDSSGNASTLTDSATVVRGNGKFGRGGDFESGSSQYQFAADNAVLSITGSLTLATWINPETVSAGSYNILAKWDGANESYRLFQNGDEIRLELDSVGNYQETTAANLTASTLYHVAGVYNSTSQTATIYINGIETASTTTGTIPSSIGDDAGRLHIGAEDSTTTAANFYDGIIDEARIYNRALSGAEISQLYNFAPGPVAYWKMNENTGTTISDSSGNANTSSAFTGNVAFINGKYGSGLTFDGTDDVVRIVESSTTDLGATADSYTISFWFKTSTDIPAGAGMMFNKRNAGGGGFPFQIRMQANETVTAAFFDGTTTISSGSTASYNNGVWHHVAAVRNVFTDTIYLYIDGTLVDSDSDTTTAGFANNSDISIGNGNTSATYDDSDFTGTIDEPKIHNYARTPAQIVEDMNAGHPAPGSPVGSAVAYWKFEEGALNTCSGGTNDFCDSSTLANNLAFSTTSGGHTLSGKFGKAFNGDGTVWASRTTDGDLEFSATADFSLSLWIKSDSPTNPANGIEYLVSDTTGNTDVGFSIYANTDGTICFGIDDDATWGPDVSSCTTADFYDATWHYITAVRNVTLDKTYIYIDALEKDSDTDSTTATLDGNNTFFVGDFDGDNNGTAGIEEFAGDIDELKVYRLALTPEQIKADMNRGSSQVLGALGSNSSFQVQAGGQEYCIPGDSTTCTSPAGEWKMDEGTGNTVSIYDRSTNGNNGTSVNALWTSGKFGGGLGANIFALQHAVNVTDPASEILDFTDSEDYTTSIWFKGTVANDTSTAAPLSKGGLTSTSDGYSLQVSSVGIVTCQYVDDDNGASPDSASGTTNVLDNKWHLLACAMDRDGGQVGTTGLHVFVDARVEGSDTSLDEGDSSNATALTFGEVNASREFGGSFDQVRIYDYARTRAQIAWDYNRGAPVGHWKMDECQGTTLNDSAGNSLTGTWSGSLGGNTSAGDCNTVNTATAWYNGVTGKKNYSLDLDGTDDVVTVTNADAIDFDTTLAPGVTFSAWIYAGSAGENSVGEILDKGTNTFLRVDTLSGSNLDVQGSLDLGTTDATLNISTAITTNSWNHVAMVYSDDGDDEIEIYINGVLRGTSTDGSGAPATTDTNNLLIGGDSAANFDGQIDDFKVFNYGLTSTQVQTLYNDGAAHFGPTTGAP